MSNDGGVVTKGGFKFKRPGNSLSLSKPKPPALLIKSERQTTLSGHASFVTPQHSHNSLSGRVGLRATPDKGQNSVAPKPDSFEIGQNNGNNRLEIAAKPAFPGTALGKDEDVTIVSQSKLLRDVSNVSGPRKMVDKIKKPSTFQTSITAFTMQNRPKPVAAVAPHRSPPKPESKGPPVGGKRKSDELDNWNMRNLSSMFSSFDDDNDSDFDMDMPTGSPAFKKTLTQSAKKLEQKKLADSVSRPDETEDDVISFRPKRRRTLELDDSEDEETLNKATDTEKNIVEGNTNQGSEEFKDNLCEETKIYDLQMRLLKATDQICDIIMQLSNADLMSMLKKNYTTIQNLLLTRDSIKEEAKGFDLLHHVTHSSEEPRNNVGELKGNLKGQNSKPCVKSQGYQRHNANGAEEENQNVRVSTPSSHPFKEQTHVLKSLPDSTTASKSDCGRLSDTSRNFGSPIPCGDSFFEDDAILTQTHVDFMSNFKRHSLPGSTNANNSNFSTPESKTSTPVIKGHLVNSVSVDLQSSPNQTSNCSVLYGQEKACALNQSSNFVSPNRNKRSARTSINSHPYDSVDDEFNLELAEQSDFDFDYKVSSACHSKKSTEKGSYLGASSQETVDRCSASDREINYEIVNESGEDLFEIDDFDEEDFGEILECDEKLPSVSHTSRAITGSRDHNSGNVIREKSRSPAPEHKEYAHYNFSHCKEMMKVFNKVFGLQRFRHHQLEACNAALLGNDTFILMPTGGGKSLCYQLPALVSGGVSLVISPLRALIQDQVQKLHSLQIPAGHLSSDVGEAEASMLYSKLHKRVPEVKLLYVTPEKISASGKLMSVLENLYNRQLLDRFVIDEAHCVSSWGHDFRPDYKKLSILRQKFPGVPIMALTATATMRVRKDICHQLLLKDPKWFTQSFNRPNLKMEVLAKKPSSATKDVIRLIKEKFPGKCGIVYCLSRKECDDVASDLSKAGILSVSYHAGLSDSERTMIQEKWLNGNRCKVICATIAFGMGIDKPDVRFVIHYSIPKSVEGYYQEAGRAGRDGLLSSCILLYTYADVKRWRRIIEMDKSATYDSKRVHIDNLFRMIQYCENVYDCRRAQLLHYFGEHKFDRAKCSEFRGAICDNCVSKETFQLRDVTEDARLIIKCVRDLTSGRKADYTLIHFIEIFKGSKNKNIVDKGHDKHPLHGRGTVYSRHDADRLFRKLVIDGVLYEELKITAMDTAACYIKLGRRANDVLSGKLKVELQVQENRKKTEVQIGREPVSKKQTLIDDCYNELMEMAKTLASESGVFNWSNVFRTNTLRQMAEMTPTSVEELRKIEGITNNNIGRFGDQRMLDITTKFCGMVASLEDSLVAFEDNDPEEWSSHYFPAPSASGGGRGGKKNGFKKKYITKKKKAVPKTGGRKKTVTATTGGDGTKAGWISKSNNFSQYKYRANTIPRSGGMAAGGGSRQPSGSSGLGMMPVPQPKRSFLSGGGQYLG